MQLDMFAIGIETCSDSDKGSARYRDDKRLKRYLLAKRPDANATDRIVSYRTEACTGYNQAFVDHAGVDVLEALKLEHGWAMERLAMLAPEIHKRFAY